MKNGKVRTTFTKSSKYLSIHSMETLIRYFSSVRIIYWLQDMPAQGYHTSRAPCPEQNTCKDTIFLWQRKDQVKKWLWSPLRGRIYLPAKDIWTFICHRWSRVGWRSRGEARQWSQMVDTPDSRRVCQQWSLSAAWGSPHHLSESSGENLHFLHCRSQHRRQQ